MCQWIGIVGSGLILGQRDNQERYDDRAAAIANEFFDLILVHSDPSFARLEESFHPLTPLRVPVHYTGFVMPRRQACCDAKRDSGRKKIVVSAGGGMVGEPLLRAAIQAHGLFSPDEHIEMKIIAGLFLHKPSWHSLHELAYGRRGLTLRRHVSELCGEMLGAAASVSQCGYNTTLDILRTGVPALVVPYADGTEDEQLKRAVRLGNLGAIHVLEERDVNPARLSSEIRELFDFRVSKPDLDLDGVRNSVQRIWSMIRGVSIARDTVTTGPKLREMRQVNA